MITLKLLYLKLTHIAAAFWLSITGFFAGPPAPVTASDVQPAILMLNVNVTASVRSLGSDVWSDPIMAHMSCTAFFVDDTGRAITARHCVSPDETKRAVMRVYLGQNASEKTLENMMKSYVVANPATGSEPTIAIKASQPYGWTMGQKSPLNPGHTVTVIDSDPDDGSDQAMLQVEDLEGPAPYLKIASTSPAIGDPIVAIGYPGIDENLPPFVFSPGYVISTPQTSMLDMTSISAPMWQGMSGGPTINPQGEVVGVNKALFAKNPAFTFSTEYSDVKSFMKEQHVTQPLTNDISHLSASDWAVVSVLSGSIGIVMFILLVVIRRHRKALLAPSN